MVVQPGLCWTWSENSKAGLCVGLGGSYDYLRISSFILLFQISIVHSKSGKTLTVLNVSTCTCSPAQNK